MTEQTDDRYQDLDTWPFETILAALVESNRRAVQAVKAALPALEEAALGIALALAKGGRLVYIGAGTSGRLALQDAAELLPTFGFDRTVVLMAGGDGAAGRAREGAEDDEAAARAAVAQAEIGEKDAVIGLAASGRTPYTVAGVEKARALGAFTAGVSNNPDTPLLSVAEVGILLETGPEVLAGSTRLAAGTSQKIVLNALSTAVLVRSGGAYGNLMVGMKPLNDKLRLRAVSIVRQATEVGEAEAEAALKASDGLMREAIVMLKAGINLDEAKARLERHGGRVRDALEP